MPGQTIILAGESQRNLACSLIGRAPERAVVTIKEATRSSDQNAKMWSMISDVSRAKPEGRHWTTDTWKAAFMHMVGHQIQFEQSLDNNGPFPTGFKSSRLTKSEMADLITGIQAYGDNHGVVWSDPSFGSLCDTPEQGEK
jgi:hypothetical protein